MEAEDGEQRLGTRAGTPVPQCTNATGAGASPLREGPERRRDGKITTSFTQEAIVLFLRSFAPLATMYTLYRIAVAIVLTFFPTTAPKHPSLPTLPIGLEVFIYLETLFLIYMMWRTRVLARRQLPPPINREEIDLIVERMITHTTDMKELISGWFMDAPFDELSRDDIWAFVLWMLFSKYPEELESGEERDAVSSAVKAIEKAIGHEIPTVASGGASKHVCMRHTLDPLRSKHRPLLAYFITHWLLNTVCASVMLGRLGFRKYRAGSIAYWHRPAPSAAPPRRLPIVFVHGIGMGLFTYYHFVQQLAALPAELFFIELPHASLRICETVPADRQAVSSLLQMLQRHHHSAAVFTGHSLGSVYISWMCRLAPQAVAASVFLEPIVFMLFLKTVTSNFLYEEYGGIVGYAIRSELFLNHALRRNFWWFRNVLWVEDVTHPCHVFLCEADEVVPSREVVRYIHTHDRGHHITTEVMDTDWHGAWLFERERVDRIVLMIGQRWREQVEGGKGAGGEEEGRAAEGVMMEEEGKTGESMVVVG